MSDFLNGSGFLGTHAPLRADLSMILILLSVALFTVGVVLAKRKRFAPHQAVETIAIILNALVVLVGMISAFLNAVLPGIQLSALDGFALLALLHALTGLFGVLLGVFILLRTNNLVPGRLRFKKYKPVMRAAYTLYLLAAALGVWFYILLYV